MRASRRALFKHFSFSQGGFSAGGSVMRNVSLSALALMGACGVGASSVAADTISSTFDVDADGWTTTNVVPVFTPAGGNPGGFLLVDNPETTITEMIAPAKFLGDLSLLNGGTLS